MRLLLVALVFSLALPAAAQQPGRPFGPAKASRYVEFDFDVDADALVRQRLADAEKLDQFKKLLKDILTDPKRKIDPKLIEKLKLGDGKWLDRLGDLKPAKLPRWDWSPPAPPRGALPNVSTPSLPAASALGTIAIWLICIVLAALVLWQASRWLKGSRRAAQRTFGLGPWPVDPQQVASRAELVKAFDYLAVLVFGAKARPWNHRTVARSLAERAEPLTHLAAELAALYEEARYTDGESALSPDQCELARHALNKLAGVAPA